MTTLLIFLFSFHSYAFHPDFKVVNDNAPYEFNQLFNSMKYQLKENKEQIKMLALCQNLNQNLSKLDQAQSFALLKSETYKKILGKKFQHGNSYQVSPITLERLQKKLQENQAIYTPFSKWIIQSMLADFDQEKELIGKDPSVLDKKKQQHYYDQKKKLAFLSKWLGKADTLSATSFNELTLKISWEVLDSVNSMSKFFANYSSKTGQGLSQNLFNIPDEAVKQASQAIQNDSPIKREASLSEKSETERIEARQLTEQISPGQDLSGQEIDLSKAIDTINPQGEDHSPIKANQKTHPDLLWTPPKQSNPDLN